MTKEPLTITPESLPAFHLGQNNPVQLVAGGGTTPYTFAITTGALPPGMTLSKDGNISGAPQEAGDTYAVSVTVTDSATPATTTTTTFDVQVDTAKKAQA